MKTVAAAVLCFFALAASAQAIRTDEFLSEILSQQVSAAGPFDTLLRDSS